jgi:hypothetical protein
MPTRERILMAGAAVLCAAAMLGAGCASSEVTPPSADSGAVTATKAAAAQAPTAPVVSLSATTTAAVDARLRGLQAEIGRVAMPSGTDFDSIQSGLK